MTNKEIDVKVNKMKQTAVEWLFNQMSNVAAGYVTELNEQEILDKAKEMEKQQIKEVFIEVSNVLLKETNTQQKAKIKQAAEQYYNETFKSE